MKPGSSKAKGSSFERRVCADLSLWLSNGERTDLLWRSSLSGGRSTIGSRKGKVIATQAGDICSIDPLSAAFASKFFCECKHVVDLNIPGLIKGTGHIFKFWALAKKEAKKYNKLPMLIAKQNNFPTLVCLNYKGMTLFELAHSFHIASCGMYGLEWERFLHDANKDML